MSVSLKSYQEEKVVQLTDIITGLLAKGHTVADRKVVFVAPTGSGKTVILACVIDQIQANLENDCAILWITPGEGDLEEQSHKKLTQVLGRAASKVSLLDSAYLARTPKMASDEVLVTNWELLVGDNSETGESSRMAMRRGEKRNLLDILENTHAAGTDLLVIVDESHKRALGPQTQKVLAQLYSACPHIMLEATATPTTSLNPKLISDGLQAHIEVSREEVAESGMITKSVSLLNDGVDLSITKENYPDLGFQDLLLQASWDKRTQMEQAYQEEGSSVIPLLLVQIPNGKEGDTRAASVKRYLTEVIGLPKAQIAEWLSESKTANLVGISENTSPVRVLIFKVAVATGWDCPRASVLLAYRKVNSKTLQLQTLGRITRMPELKHYTNELLNDSYVYADISDTSFSCLDVPDDQKPAIKNIRLTVKPNLYGTTGLLLTSYYQPWVKYYETIPLSVRNYLRAELSKVFKDLPNEPSELAWDDTLAINIEIVEAAPAAAVATLVGKNSETKVQALVDALVTQNIAPFTRPNSNRPRLKTIVVKWFKENYPAYNLDQVNRACVLYREQLVAAIGTAVQKCAEEQQAEATRSAAKKRKVNTQWEILGNGSKLVSEDECTTSTCPGYLLDPPLVPPLSEPEKQVAEILSKAVSAGTVRWWFKNGDKAETELGVPYQHKDKNGQVSTRITYPDYLVMSTSGKLYVLEVKGLLTHKDGEDTTTYDKLMGLISWAAEQNDGTLRAASLETLPQVKAVVVVPHQGTLYAGDVNNWTHRTREAIRTKNGWAPFTIF